MTVRFVRLVLFLMLASLSVLACDLSSLSSLGLGQASKPKVTIQSPTAANQFREGDDVPVQSLATDSTGIARVELAVDGTLVRADAPPVATGQTSFTLIQKWKATAGPHTLTVRAFNIAGGASDPVIVSITVAPAIAEVPTIAPVLPTVPAPLGSTPNATSLPTIPPSGVTPTSAVSPTIRPAPRPSASPTIAAPPGVWATSISIDPNSAKRGVPVVFKVTFLNTTQGPQSYRWFVKIYQPDARNSFGETSKTNGTMDLGLTTLQAPVDWKIGGPGDCMPFIARVFWEDPGNKVVTEFIKPDQSGGPATSFQVCP